MVYCIRRTLSFLLLIVLVASGALGVAKPVRAAATHVVITERGDLTDTTTCTLRKAIHAATMINDGKKYNGCEKGIKTIYLQEGTIENGAYTLTIARTQHIVDGIDPLEGDLDITTGLAIIGMDGGATIKAGAGFNDRIFHIDTKSFVALSNLTITGGNGESYETENITGGGINFIGSYLTLQKVNIFENGFPNEYSKVERLGGGIFNRNGTLTILDSTIDSNWAKHGAGIYNGGTLMMRNSLVYNNRASDTGGGIDSTPVAPLNANRAVLTNTTIAANTLFSGNGAGIYVGGGSTLELTHTTIVDNGLGSSQLVGLYKKATATVIMRNSLMINNGYHCQLEDNTKITTKGYNLLDADQDCAFHSTGFEDKIMTDTNILLPKDGSMYKLLANNGGPTRTYALSPGSLAIDGVPFSHCAAADDQRGLNRWVEGKTHCDIGAYEDDASENWIRTYLPLINR
jgi:hypothetical protein